MLVHRVARPLRGSVSCGSGWSVPCVSVLHECEVDGEEEVAERRARATDGEETEVVEMTDRWEGFAA